MRPLKDAFPDACDKVLYVFYDFETTQNTRNSDKATIHVPNFVWLEDAYTLHRPAKKRFAWNPYTVTNVMDVWECNLLDVQAYAKYNDNYKYILSVIDIFSKFLFLVSVKTKSSPAVTRAFLSIFDDDPK